MHVAKDRGKAVVYAYDMHPRFGEKLFPVKLQGLDPQKKYKVEEINLLPGKKSRLRENDAVFSGDYLMKVGLDLLTTAHTSSRIIELTVQ